MSRDRGDFARALALRDKRFLFVYSRRERAADAFRAFADVARVEAPGAVVLRLQRRVVFPEGGWVEFRCADDEFRGTEIDDFWVDEVASNRLGPNPLVTLLATRRRP